LWSFYSLFFVPNIIFNCGIQSQFKINIEYCFIFRIFFYLCLFFRWQG
jgi:hypothetical protein